MVLGKTKGDCYYAAFRMITDSTDEKLLLVQGEVEGGGVKHGHAWLEKDEMAIDPSNGQVRKMPKDLYYAIGNISKTFNNKKEVRYWAVKTGHAGPWELITESGL